MTLQEYVVETLEVTPETIMTLDEKLRFFSFGNFVLSGMQIIDYLHRPERTTLPHLFFFPTGKNFFPDREKIFVI